MGFVELATSVIGEKPVGKWAIYALVDPRDSLVRYVGFTRGTLKSRLAKHIAQPTNGAMHEWIGSLRSAGLMPQAMALEYVQANQSDWQHAERKWIAWFRARGNLLNIQAGGEVTRPMVRPPDKSFPLSPGDLPTKRRNPYGRFGLWNQELDTWFEMNKASSSSVVRGKLDPRWPHASDCPCRKCALG